MSHQCDKESCFGSSPPAVAGQETPGVDRRKPIQSISTDCRRNGGCRSEHLRRSRHVSNDIRACFVTMPKRHIDNITEYVDNSYSYLLPDHDGWLAALTDS